MFSKKLDARWSFALVAALAGLVYAFTIPPLQTPDEAGHFERMLMVSRGEFLACSAAPLPVEMSADVGADLIAAYFTSDGIAASTDVVTWAADTVGIPLSGGQKVMHGIAYLPQAVGALVAGDQASFITRLHAGRIAGLLASTALMTLALHLLPFGRWTIALVALLPMAVFLRSSLTIDGLLLAAGVLLAALLLNWRDRLQRGLGLSFLSLTGLLAVCGLFAVTKAVYLSLLILIVPIALQPGARRLSEIAKALGVVGFSSALALAWAARITANCASIRTDQDPSMFNISAKKALLLAEPMAFLHLLYDTILADGSALYQQVIGTFGTLNITMPPIFYVAASVFLAVAIFTDRAPPLREPLSLAVAGVAAVAVGSVGLFLSLWLLWTPLNATQIEGMQGRYFLPLLPTLGLAVAAARAGIRPNISVPPAFGLTFVVALICWGQFHALDRPTRETLRRTLAVRIDTPAENPPPLGGGINSTISVGSFTLLKGWAPWSATAQPVLAISTSSAVKVIVASPAPNSGFCIAIITAGTDAPLDLQLTAYDQGVPIATLPPAFSRK
jgi:hypothetical protein